MTSKILYGEVADSYLDIRRFEAIITKKAIKKQKEINSRKFLSVFDKVVISIIAILLIVFSFNLGGIVYENICYTLNNNKIYELQTSLSEKVNERKNIIAKLKENIDINDLRKKAYLDLGMVNPTDKNIIYFDKIK